MIKPIKISEKLIFSTVRLQVGSSVGSGFFFQFFVKDDVQIPVIITNKHVIQNSDIVSFSLHLKNDENDNPSGKYISVNYKSKWIFHPKDDVDLCATPVQPLITQVIEQHQKKIYYSSFEENLIWDDQKLEDLGAIEDVTMIGYPIGLWDHIHNLPVVRKGITSTHPAIDFQKKSLGLADIACFPGSSGSPIVLLNEGFYSTKSGTNVGNRIILLGVLSSGPTYDSEGDIVIKEIPTQKIVKTKNHNMINLGYYVKAKEIFELKDHFFKELKIEEK